MHINRLKAGSLIGIVIGYEVWSIAKRILTSTGRAILLDNNVIKQGSCHSPTQPGLLELSDPGDYLLRWMSTLNVPASPYAVSVPFTCCLPESQAIPEPPSEASDAAPLIVLPYKRRSLKNFCFLLKYRTFFLCPLGCCWDLLIWHPCRFEVLSLSISSTVVDKSYIDPYSQTSLAEFRIS